MGGAERTSVGENGGWDQVPAIRTKNNVTSHQVSGLLPFTVYSFRVIAINELGRSPPSKESYYFVTLREACLLDDPRAVINIGTNNQDCSFSAMTAQ
nr:neural cell adhesion molecule L1-like protein [Aedes albopictus]